MKEKLLLISTYVINAFYHVMLAGVVFGIRHDVVLLRPVVVEKTVC